MIAARLDLFLVNLWKGGVLCSSLCALLRWRACSWLLSALAGDCCCNGTGTRGRDPPPPAQAQRPTAPRSYSYQPSSGTFYDYGSYGPAYRGTSSTSPRGQPRQKRRQF